MSDDDRVSEADIAKLVDAFYAKVRRDPLLAPVFASRITDNAWPVHLATLRDFWSSVMLGTGRYKGTPLLAHRRLEGLSKHHFAQWLTLFEATAHEVLEQAKAAAFSAKAKRIGESLQIGLLPLEQQLTWRRP